MADETEETADGSTPDEAPAVEPETSAAADSSQGASPEADPSAADGPVAKEPAGADAPEAEESASADAEVDEESASADAEVDEEPASEDAEVDEKPASEDAEEAPTAEVSEDDPAAEADEKPAKAAKPKRADRAASTPRRQRGGERKRAGREPGEPAPVVRAQAKYVRSSARKARLVCDHIRGKSVVEARAILAVTPRAIARDWSKLLESAVANAEHNHELVGEDLVVKAVHADEGPTIKRFRPRAMGRATRIRKRTSHLTILLTPKD
jgi:ribosomal protein L22